MTLSNLSTFDWTLTPANARARCFIEHVTDLDLDDDLDNPTVPDWPPLLGRRLAAQYLGVGMKWLSDIWGNGPKGGRLKNYKIRGKVHWRREDIQAYRERGNGR